MALWGGTYTNPGFQDSPNITELYLQNAYRIAEGAALWAIFKSVNAAKCQLINGMNSRDAWNTLFLTLNKQDGSHQFQLFRDLTCTPQNTNGPLTAYHQYIELAADHLYTLFTSGMTAKDVVDSMAAYFLLLGLEKDVFNAILSYHITQGANQHFRG